MRTIITVPDTVAGKIIARELGRIAIVRPVASDNDNFGHVQGDYAEELVRALRQAFADLVWNVAPIAPSR
jgi:hypothetical protein